MTSRSPETLKQTVKIFKQLQPDDPSLDIMLETATRIDAICPQRIQEITSFLRRRVYSLGLLEGAEKIHEHAESLAQGEQKKILAWKNPEEEDTTETYEERKEKWRTMIALKALALLEEEKREKIIGLINSRFRKKAQPERIKEALFNKEGNLKISPVRKNIHLDLANKCIN